MITDRFLEIFTFIYIYFIFVLEIFIFLEHLGIPYFQCIFELILIEFLHNSCENINVKCTNFIKFSYILMVFCYFILFLFLFFSFFSLFFFLFSFFFFFFPFSLLFLPFSFSFLSFLKNFGGQNEILGGAVAPSCPPLLTPLLPSLAKSGSRRRSAPWWMRGVAIKSFPNDLLVFHKFVNYCL